MLLNKLRINMEIKMKMMLLNFLFLSSIIFAQIENDTINGIE